MNKTVADGRRGYQQIPAGDNAYHRIAELMRSGSRTTKQVFNALRDGRGGTCAAGAVLVGAGTDHFRMLPEPVRYYLLHSRHVTCPVCGFIGPGTLANTTYHLNDDHKWKREKIADWLDSLAEEWADSLAEEEEAVDALSERIRQALQEQYPARLATLCTSSEELRALRVKLSSSVTRKHPDLGGPNGSPCGMRGIHVHRD